MENNVKHLKILGKGSPKLLGDIEFVRNFIIILVDFLGMKSLGEPTIHDVELDIKKLGQEPFSDEGGISIQIVGFNTLTTSHVALHTWPIRDEFHLDIYSCRYFDKEKTQELVEKYFECYKMKVTDLSYATEW